MKYSNSTTIGKDGRPIKEIFQTNTKGAIGPDGKKITERHQMYENTGTGHQKMAHERMLDGQGRKVVKQRIGNEQRQEDLYRNMREDQAGNFDDAWNSMADRVGFNYQGNRLGYSDQGFGSRGN